MLKPRLSNHLHQLVSNPSTPHSIPVRKRFKISSQDLDIANEFRKESQARSSIDASQIEMVHRTRSSFMLMRCEIKTAQPRFFFFYSSSIKLHHYELSANSEEAARKTLLQLKKLYCFASVFLFHHFDSISPLALLLILFLILCLAHCFTVTVGFRSTLGFSESRAVCKSLAIFLHSNSSQISPRHTEEE
jgi:hypothetical protein